MLCCFQGGRRRCKPQELAEDVVRAAFKTSTDMGPEPPVQQQTRRERLRFKNGFREFQVQTVSEKKGRPQGYTAGGSMRLKGSSSLGSACHPRETLALWGHESQVLAGEDLELPSQQRLQSGYHGPGCVQGVRNFQPITGLGWSISGLASPLPPVHRCL